jgi:hypothetical protein
MAKLLENTVKDGDFKDVEGESEDISELQDSLDTEIREALSTLNSDPNDQTIYFKVLKQEKGSRKPWECFIANMSELDGIGERIRLQYGSGWYIVNIIKNGKLFKKIDYPILAPIAPANNNQQSDLAALLNALSQNQERQFQQLKEVLLQGTGRAAVPTDPIEMMKSMAAAMVSMRDMMQPAQTGNSLKDALETITVLKDLLPDRSGGESNVFDVIGKALESPILGNILEGAAQAAKQGKPAQLAAPQPGQSAPPTQEQPPQAQSEEEMKAMIIKGYVANLVKRAQNNQDPQFVAEVLLNDASMYGIPHEVIKSEILSKEALDKLSAEHQGITLYRAWFDAVQNELNALLNGEQPAA